MDEFSANELRLEKFVCNLCRGVARLCKLNTCPFYREVLREAAISRLSSGSFYGPSPPTIIVGEKNYPRVWAGTAVSLTEQPQPGLLEEPRKWLDASLEQLLKIRLSLFYGRVKADVRSAARSGRVLEVVQHSSASSKPVDIEVVLAGSPVVRPGFGVRMAPHGPSARVEDVKLVGNITIPRKVESFVDDPYVSAEEAIQTLYVYGVDEYYLARVFSSGLLGRPADRRLVPTEWSITAVDDILGRRLYHKVRDYNIISEYRLHSHGALENHANIILTPTPWMFELLEGWLKHTGMSPYADYELLKPRKEYAENTGGAYYAVRFAVLNHLAMRREQAGALVFFEIGPGWIPLGVWRFREIVRKALEKPCERFHTLEEALNAVRGRVKMPLQKYLHKSRLINFLAKQQRLTP